MKHANALLTVWSLLVPDQNTVRLVDHETLSVQCIYFLWCELLKINTMFTA